jgi:hypothetical protein
MKKPLPGAAVLLSLKYCRLLHYQFLSLIISKKVLSI